MQIRMKVRINGTNGHTGQSWPAIGEVTEVNPAEAARMINRGMATAVKAHKSVEVAQAKTVAETAEAPKPVKRGRGRPPKKKD